MDRELPRLGDEPWVRQGRLHGERGVLLQALGLVWGESNPLKIEVWGDFDPDLFIGEGRDPLYPESVRDVRGEILPWLET